MTDALQPEPQIGRPARTLRLPADRSVGMLVVMDPANGVPDPPQPAQGLVEVPAARVVTLACMPPGAADAAVFAQLQPDDVDMLVSAPADDECLRAIGHLTGLHTLVGEGETSDVGLSHVGRLVNLAMVKLQLSPVVTAEGVAHLSRLPKLARLALEGPVSAETLQPLVDAPKLSALQLPQADDAVVDAMRDTLPDLTINGVWLSAAARRRLDGGPS
jgi:hypothetical protein